MITSIRANNNNNNNNSNNRENTPSNDIETGLHDNSPHGNSSGNNINNNNGTPMVTYRQRLLHLFTSNMCSTTLTLFFMLILLSMPRLPPMLFLFVSLFVGLLCITRAILIFNEQRRQFLNGNGGSMALLAQNRLNPLFHSINFRLSFIDRDFNENDYETLLQLDNNTPQLRGLPQGQIDLLPQHIVAVENPNDGNVTKQTCAICLENLKVGEAARALPCCHQFHIQCVDKWLRMEGNCPVCKFQPF